jgi:hypothetical protein
MALSATPLHAAAMADSNGLRTTYLISAALVETNSITLLAGNVRQSIFFFEHRGANNPAQDVRSINL